MVNLASQSKVVIAYEAYLFSNASLSRPSWPHVSEVLPAICNLREKLVPHCDCNIILHNSNSKPVWTSPIGKWVKKGRKKNRKILKKRSVSGAFCESSTLGSGGAWGVRHLERYKVIVAHLIWLRRKRRNQEQQTKFKKSVLRKVLLVLNACTEQCYCVETSSGELRYVIQGNLLRASCYSAKDTLSATVQRIRYVRRVSPAYDSCSRSRRGETSCLLARWRGKQDQMRETIAQAKRQVGVKRSSRKIGKI